MVVQVVNPRSIPACAGEPVRLVQAAHWQEVYPRVCGGTITDDAGNIIRNGLSPRVRGNLVGSATAVLL